VWNSLHFRGIVAEVNRHRLRILAATVAGTFAASASLAVANDIVPTNFNGYGTSLSGFQDFFTESTAAFNANYTEISNGNSVATGSTGNFSLSTSTQTLLITGGAGDPNKLLYNGHYDSGNQTVLAEIAVTDDPGGASKSDGWRGGVTTVSNANGGGIDQVFRTNGYQGSNGHTALLNDSITWDNNGAVGSNLTYASATPTYYWVKLTTTTSSGTNYITGEIWPADGTTPESDAQTATWTQSGGSLRSGLAGLVADSGDTGTFTVNYLLIESAGLPTITAGIVPEPASLALLSLGSLALLMRRRRRA
jgi:hypothetical protein